MKNSGKGFSNDLYSQEAQNYHNFVSRYQLDKIIEIVSGRFNGTDLNILELGAGTGTITIPASKKCKSITAVELHNEQIAILKQQLKHEKVQNVDIYNIDALVPETLPPNKYDIILFSFSLDNICQFDVYGTLDISTMDNLLDTYKSFLAKDGQYILIGSMPQESIQADQKEIYLKNRKKQFSFLENKKDFSIDFIDYQVNFASYESALEITRPIYGDHRAMEALQSKNFINLKAYIASFKGA